MAARLVTGATRGTSHALLYMETGWETLKERRRKQKLKMMYKITKKQAPSTLSNLLPDRNMDRTHHNTRSRENVIIPHASTNTFKDFYFPDTLRMWNALPPTQRNLSTYEAFCNSLGKPSKKPSRFYQGNRRSQILHTRIRLECSPLNYHLHKKNIVDNPGCQCGGWCESAKHYLLECSLYRQQRANLLDYLRDLRIPVVNTETLLFGDNNMDESKNIKLFIAVQNYIVETERFT
jgi:hypothetical protein